MVVVGSYTYRHRRSTKILVNACVRQLIAAFILSTRSALQDHSQDEYPVRFWVFAIAPNTKGMDRTPQARRSAELRYNYV